MRSENLVWLLILNLITFLNFFISVSDDECEPAYTKYFFIPVNFTASFDYARVILQNSSLEFATLESAVEARALMQMLRNRTDGHGYISIGGQTTVLKSYVDWFWTESGKKINFPMQWKKDEPNNNQNSGEYCLGLGPGPDYQFFDSSCSNFIKFVAQIKLPMKIL